MLFAKYIEYLSPYSSSFPCIFWCRQISSMLFRGLYTVKRLTSVQYLLLSHFFSISKCTKEYALTQWGQGVWYFQPFSPVNSTHKGQWRRVLTFSLIWARINSWVNNREAGDLRRHRVHYDIIVMHYTLVVVCKTDADLNGISFGK